jgi:hypothetical protein
MISRKLSASTGRLAAFAVAAAAVGSVCAMSLANASSSGVPPARSADAPGSGASTPTAFAVLDANASTGATIPAAALSGLVGGGDPFGLNTAAVQGVATPIGTVWVVPGTGGACLTWSAGTTSAEGAKAFYPAACAPLSVVDDGKLWGATSGDGTRTFVGLAPDVAGKSISYVAADGSTQTLSVNDNVYAWTGNASQTPRAFDIVTSGGTTATVTLPSAVAP